MPSVNVRFSDEQHEVLRRAAFDRGRGWSLQKEIIERLFGNGLSAGASTDVGLGANDGSPSQAKADGSSVVAAGERSAPAAKPCKRAHLHHTNHGGAPCPVCGWPDTADWKKGK